MGFRNVLNTTGSPNWVRNRVKHGNSGSWLFSGGWGLSFCHIVAVLSTLRMCWHIRHWVFLFTVRWSADCQCVLRGSLIDWLTHGFSKHSQAFLNIPNSIKGNLFFYYFCTILSFRTRFCFLVWGIQCFVPFLPSCQTKPPQLPLLLVLLEGLYDQGLADHYQLVWIWTQMGCREPEQVWFTWCPWMDWTSMACSPLGYLRPNKSFPWPSKSPWLSHFHISVDAFILVT